jgi:hypothetical protein
MCEHPGDVAMTDQEQALRKDIRKNARTLAYSVSAYRHALEEFGVPADECLPLAMEYQDRHLMDVDE